MQVSTNIFHRITPQKKQNLTETANILVFPTFRSRFSPILKKNYKANPKMIPSSRSNLLSKSIPEDCDRSKISSRKNINTQTKKKKTHTLEIIPIPIFHDTFRI